MKGDPDAAVADYDQAIALNPQYATAYNNRGVAYYQKGDLDRAMADFDQAIALNPQYAMAYYDRGFTYVKLGEQEQAIADLERALELGLDPQYKAQAEELLGNFGH